MSEMTFDQAFDYAHQLYQSGKLLEAEAMLMQILSKLPDQAETIQLAGIAMHQIGRGTAGIEMIKRAIDLQPNSAQFQSNLGVMLAGIGDIEGALNALRRAIELEPNLPDAHNNIGNLLKVGGQINEAIAEYRLALQLRPDYPEALNNLGGCLQEQGNPEEALIHLRRALDLWPHYAEAWNNLGAVFHDLGRFEEAFDAHNRSLSLQPNNPEALVNRGNSFRVVRKFDEALRDFRAALQLQPQYAEASWSLASVELVRGNFDQGWQALESRFGIKGREVTWYVPEPLWDGSNPSGKTIILHSEEGFGDTIQFVRYAALLSSAGANVVLLCQPELRRLLTGQLGIQLVTSDGYSRPQGTWQCPLLSLPRIFRTTLSNIPARGPYLTPDTALVARWRDRVNAAPPGLKIGLAWAGNPAHKNDRQRSIPLKALNALAQIPGIQLFSLQKARPRRDANTPFPSMIDWTPELTDFADTAALIANLDLVVSADTAIAHLAGALGKAACVLLPYAPDWRWLLDRPDSPWYPSMRLVRQPSFGDWETPIRQLTEQLTRLSNSK